MNLLRQCEILMTGLFVHQTQLLLVWLCYVNVNSSLH